MNAPQSDEEALSADADAAGGLARRALLGLAGVMLLLRLFTLASYPLMDTSEARYGEIARVMLQTGNWVTPQETPGTPFWAKPPLSTWLSAASMQLFGVGEFALRLPSLLCALVVAWLCHGWCCALFRPGDVRGPRAGLIAVAVLATSVLFFVSAGAVMTDPALALCTTAMLVAFHRCVLLGERGTNWRYGFFVAAGLSMLAKGPVILLYVGAPIGLWALWQRRVGACWRALPWAGGTLLAAAICLPWYALAEQRTPGFLAYFLVGEHFMRFLKPGWGGDLHGTAHAEPLGTIWLYLAGALGCNVLLLAFAAWQRWRSPAGPVDAAARRFLLLSALVPPAFFTFAGNIIWTYALPALGPLAVWIGTELALRGDGRLASQRPVLGVLFAASLSVAGAILFWVPRHVDAHSSARLVAALRAEDPPPGARLVYLGRKAPASLRFYARGRAEAVDDPQQALAGIEADGLRYLALPPGEVDALRARVAAEHPALQVQAVAQNTDVALLRLSVAR